MRLGGGFYVCGGGKSGWWMYGISWRGLRYVFHCIPFLYSSPPISRIFLKSTKFKWEKDERKVKIGRGVCGYPCIFKAVRQESAFWGV